MLRGFSAIILFSCGPSPLFPIHLPHIALLRWQLVAAFFSFVLSAYCHCLSCLHALFRLLFISFFRPSAHYSVSPSSYLSNFFFLGFYLFMRIFRRDFLFPCTWSVLLSCGRLLFCFNLACFLLLLVFILLAANFSHYLAVVISLSPLFAFVALTFFLAEPIVCLSVAFLLCPASPSHSLL